MALFDFASQTILVLFSPRIPDPVPEIQAFLLSNQVSGRRPPAFLIIGCGPSESFRIQRAVTIVQQILGHSNLNTTAIYLQFSDQEAKLILKDRGLI